MDIGEIRRRLEIAIMRGTAPPIAMELYDYITSRQYSRHSSQMATYQGIAVEDIISAAERRSGLKEVIAANIALKALEAEERTVNLCPYCGVSLQMGDDISSPRTIIRHADSELYLDHILRNTASREEIAEMIQRWLDGIHADPISKAKADEIALKTAREILGE